jgi:uncharacterized protein YdiU (UPF0061 family)
MIVEWMRVGFVHGVMNTDNMSILGLTIDYGPYSFLDAYDPLFTPNTTDLPGRRYAFGRQAAIGKWNLACLAGSVAPLVEDASLLAAVVQTYDDVFGAEYYAMMGRKLGLTEVGDREGALIDKLVEVLSRAQPDYTLFFQKLESLPAEGAVDSAAFFGETFYKQPDGDGTRLLQSFIEDYQGQMRQLDAAEREKVMQGANPRFILRNYRLHEAIEALEAGDMSKFDALHQALREPYAQRGDDLAGMRPDWAAQKAGCSMLSCSS